ncbi:hypothetical protein G6M84_17750 [Agrobacterium tumefaciens]|uniref:hypothetical protein n=1 Tax=Agrobacterium tumefaciens TaxID=358 RepID=UPI001571688D|nr:hypothetical protein [Agrobacterium tumefaciens]NTB98323.1 hypothetical protein [Agrobacterium tumefaciens]NTC45692.1 hypothetical protein [Agrobacterium tumefaciens]
MVYDKAIINLLLQRAHAEFEKGTQPRGTLEFMRKMIENNRLADYFSHPVSQKSEP